MKKELKNKFLRCALCVLAISVCICCLFACADKKVDVELSLNKSKITLELYESAELTAASSSTELSWSSSDESVVTVNDGKLFACGEGVAEVTVSAGDKSVKCEVTVIASDDVPVLELSHSAVAVDAGNAVYIECNVFYKGEKANAEVVFDSSDAGVATIGGDGKLTGVAQGEAVITVTAKYFDFEIFKTIAVSVL